MKGLRILLLLLAPFPSQIIAQKKAQPVNKHSKFWFKFYIFAASLLRKGRCILMANKKDNMKQLKIIALLLLPALVGFDCWGQDVIITPKGQLSEVDEDNEIIIHDDRIEFMDRATGDVCVSFGLKENNPYHNPQLQAEAEHTGFYNKFHLSGGGKYDLSSLSTSDVIDIFSLQNTPAPIPDDFRFGQAWQAYVARTKANTVVVQYMISFYGWCPPEQEHNCGGELLLARKNQFFVLNQNGEILLQWKDYYTAAEFILSTNGLYLGVTYGGLAEDYYGNYLWPTGILILDLYSGEEMFNQLLGQVHPLGEKDNIYSIYLSAAEDSIMLTHFDVEKKIVYSMVVSEYDWANKRINGSNFENLERGFYWYGKIYTWENDFLQTPFNKQLKAHK